MNALRSIPTFSIVWETSIILPRGREKQRKQIELNIESCALIFAIHDTLGQDLSEAPSRLIQIVKYYAHDLKRGQIGAKD